MSTSRCVWRILMLPRFWFGFFFCFVCLVCVCEGARANVFVCFAVLVEWRYLKETDAGELVALWLGCVTICLSSEPLYCRFLHNDPAKTAAFLLFPQALIRVSRPRHAVSHTHTHTTHAPPRPSTRLFHES